LSFFSVSVSDYENFWKMAFDYNTRLESTRWVLHTIVAYYFDVINMNLSVVIRNPFSQSVSAHS
jgi:hypothetical protein